MRHIIERRIKAAILLSQRSFGSLTLRDVLVGRNPASTGRRTIDSLNGSRSIHPFCSQGSWLTFRKNRQPLSHQGINRLPGVPSDIHAVRDHIPKVRAGFSDIRWETVESAIPFIAVDDAQLCVEHAQSLGHCPNGRIEAHVGLFELSLSLLQGSVLILQLGEKPLRSEEHTSELQSRQ